jgi:lipoic acid synthetase
MTDETEAQTISAMGPDGERRRLPRWLKVRVGKGASFKKVDALLRENGLNTVCRSALCPNVGRCFERGTATFLILGSTCTRNCRFCAVDGGKPAALDPDEPAKVAAAVYRLELRHAVITSVTRDDLADGGARHFAATVQAIRSASPSCRIELLVPDFGGSAEALETVLDSGPDILNHNIETVPRLYPRVRPGADYRRSLELLGRARRWYAEGGRDGLTKSGVMVGLGETATELEQVMAEAASAGCEMFTIGQYLQPSRGHLPVVSFYLPAAFEQLRAYGESLGFRHVASGPLVRSSYLADEQVAGHAPRSGDGSC